jgi:hypothetical protein
MFKSLRYLTIPAVLSGLVACTTAPPVTVKTTADPAAHFGKYQTYAIDAMPTGMSATGAAALQQALQSNLNARGLKQVSGKGADLYIEPVIFTHQAVNVMPGGGATFYRSSFGNFSPTSVALNAQVQQYTEGSLVIDFVDSRTHKVVYRGIAQAAVGSSTERNANAITEAVNKIVAQYP